MSVNIRIEERDLEGVVAEGAYLWDAVKRLGVRLPAECQGRGECDTCALKIREGATLLSSLTSPERILLSPDRLASGERLACQAKIERSGNLVVELVPSTERQETREETTKEMSSEFRRLPLNQKLTTLIELEAITAAQTFKAVADLPFTWIGKGLDFMAGRGRALSQKDREARRPAEHRGGEGDG